MRRPGDSLSADALLARIGAIEVARRDRALTPQEVRELDRLDRLRDLRRRRLPAQLARARARLAQLEALRADVWA